MDTKGTSAVVIKGDAGLSNVGIGDKNCCNAMFEGSSGTHISPLAGKESSRNSLLHTKSANIGNVRVKLQVKMFT